MNKIPIKKLSSETQESIVTDYCIHKLSTIQLAKKYLYSHTAIGNYLKFAGVKLRSLSHCHQKYGINEQFFDKIDTEEKAYFLGFLYADGYLYKKTGAVVLQLQKSDKEILLDLNRIIESNRPLQYIHSSKYGENNQDSYRLVINNKNIFASLTKLGLFQKKSVLLKFPTKKQLPDCFVSHFLRGYFDGDGSQSVYYPVRKNRKSSTMQSDIKILSTIEFIKSSIARMKSVGCCINFIINKRFKDEINCYNMVVSGNKNVAIFLEFIYRNAKIFLKRKYLRFCSFVAMLFNKTKQSSTTIFIKNNYDSYKRFLDGNIIKI